MNDQIKYEHHCDEENKFYVYLIMFSNNRIKIGVTGNLKKRFSYYKQEAVRHDLKIVRQESHYIVHGKSAAFDIESIVCREYKNASIKNHREWFIGDRLMYVFLCSRVQQLASFETASFFNFFDIGYDEWAKDVFFRKDFSFSGYKSISQ